jgi:hypothetical protein
MKKAGLHRFTERQTIGWATGLAETGRPDPPCLGSAPRPLQSRPEGATKSTEVAKKGKHW